MRRSNARGLSLGNSVPQQNIPYPSEAANVLLFMGDVFAREVVLYCTVSFYEPTIRPTQMLLFPWACSFPTLIHTATQK